MLAGFCHDRFDLRHISAYRRKVNLWESRLNFRLRGEVCSINVVSQTGGASYRIPSWADRCGTGVEVAVLYLAGSGVFR